MGGNRLALRNLDTSSCTVAKQGELMECAAKAKKAACDSEVGILVNVDLEEVMENSISGI